jgi:hypothetical protein
MTRQPTALPPFSGDDPTCIKCGNVGAHTKHCPSAGSVAEAWDTDRLLTAEHLERECSRCAYRWAEATIEQMPARVKEAATDG